MLFQPVKQKVQPPRFFRVPQVPLLWAVSDASGYQESRLKARPQSTITCCITGKILIDQPLTSVPIMAAFVLAPMPGVIAGHDIGGSQRAFTFGEIAKQKQGGGATVTIYHDVPGANFGLERHGGNAFRRGYTRLNERGKH